MIFPEEFRRFIAPKAERLVALAGMLASRSLPYSVLRTGEARHLALRIGQGAPALILMAHYDRVEGSPGVLDNSCACYQLVELASRAMARSKLEKGLSLLIVFTDGEEWPGLEGAASQGSLALAQAIKQAVRQSGLKDAKPPLVLVLDVTGRGDRLLLSSSPAELFARGGLGESEAARGHEALVELLRRCAGNIGMGETLSHPLPWSDDLGLCLGGLGALTMSLLPEAEARELASGLEPETWSLLHSARDDASAAEPEAFALMGALLDSLLDVFFRSSN